MSEAVEEQERQDDVAFEKAGFVAAILALVVAGAIALSWIDKAAKAREAAALEAIPDLLNWWPVSTDGGSGGFAEIAILLPLVLLLTAFRTRWGDGDPGAFVLPPSIRWALAGLCALVAGGVITASAINAGRDLGAATLSGVTWLHDGATRDAVPWSQAEQVEIACWDGELTYDVVFAGGRTAPLGRSADDDIGAWIDHVTLVDQTLRAYRVPRLREGETACLDRYDGGLIPSEKARFRAIVAG